MKKKQKIQLTEDLSYIDNLDDLESKIRQTKFALRSDERLLREGVKEIPRESIKATFGSVVPFFAKTVVAEKTWNVIQTIVSLVLNNPEKRNFKGVFDKDYLQQTLKQIGVFVGLNLVKSFMAKRQKKG
ncbi:MAG: hypothetical protein DI598_01290 [Pseudopedobacter saltans]|uniref:Uncharacterized protein n=1 Tax=Pseudopedobacter saltans TaxID=151895 RepID=A0A2W5FA15_9SPHI|nr:MAG: hypothetical protein DI598_01290 [Pseudopedobacter saltans]